MADSRPIRVRNLAAPLARIVGATFAMPAAAIAWTIGAARGASLETAIIRAVGGAAVVYVLASIAARFLLLSILESWEEERRKKVETGIR